MQALVDCTDMQTAVDPVDEEVGKDKEKWKLQDVVPETRAGGAAVIQLGITADFGEKEWDSEDCHDGKGAVGGRNLQRHLVFAVFGMLLNGLVENENVAESGKEEVNNDTEDPEIDV